MLNVSELLSPSSNSESAVRRCSCSVGYHHAKGDAFPCYFIPQTLGCLHGGNTNCDYVSLQYYNTRPTLKFIPCRHVLWFTCEMIREYLDNCSFSVFRLPLHISCQIISGFTIYCSILIPQKVCKENPAAVKIWSHLSVAFWSSICALWTEDWSKKH